MSKNEVMIIDYGVGNLLSVQRGLEHCGAKVILSSDPEVIRTARRVVLPGVGAFANAMEALDRLDLISVIHEIAQRKTPLLCICLGMQLLLDESHEFGITAGLGIIPGQVVPVPAHTTSGVMQKIPHIGWSELHAVEDQSNWEKTVLSDINKGDSAYFVHSYMAIPKYSYHRIADCLYGGHKIPSVIGFENIIGCQFHPEKSGQVGLKILQRFCEN
ncbi:imidazole glycerol phosphate synthase subunit HisH [Shewanella sp.]|uniref:imidazole glycerol phosphate synthase subunit HisH n=1 Tax=Shewanella sp. TaxID=50422 RepID=UPI00404850ED